MIITHLLVGHLSAKLTAVYLSIGSAYKVPHQPPSPMTMEILSWCINCIHLLRAFTIHVYFYLWKQQLLNYCCYTQAIHYAPITSNNTHSWDACTWHSLGSGMRGMHATDVFMHHVSLREVYDTSPLTRVSHVGMPALGGSYPQ